MDPELLSRIQFALTASFHFIFPPLSMGLGLMLVVIGIIYVRTKDPKWRQLSFFWIKIYGLIFAVGVATGVVQEFEFGMNWADYSRFVGNVFGSLLAAEGVFAFFLEGGFLGLMLFGGNRLGPKLWLFATFMVVFGAHFSALWIIMANSWMQTPAGLRDRQRPRPGPGRHDRLLAGRVHAVVHARGSCTSSWRPGRSASALMLSVSAWYVLKKRHLDLATAELQAGAAVLHRLRHREPVRLRRQHGDRGDATTSRSSWPRWRACGRARRARRCSSSAGSTRRPRPRPGSRIPCLLSVLAYSDPQAFVPGINDFPGQPTPPVNLLFQVYHVMFGLGSLFVRARPAGGLFYVWRRRRSAPLADLGARWSCGCSSSRCSSSRSRSSPAGGRPRSAASRGSSTTSC